MKLPSSNTNYYDLLPNVLLSIIITFGSLTFSSLNQNIVYTLIFIAYVAFLFYMLHQGFSDLRAPKYAVVSLGLIWFIFIYHIFLSYNYLNLLESPIVRSPIFVFASVMNIFVIPNRIRLVDFYKILLIISTTVVIVGLVSYLMPYTIFGVTVKTYFASHDLLEIKKLSSVFRGPNAFARFVLGGLIVSIFFTLYYDRRFFILFMINALGILLAYSRATLVAAAIGVGLYVVYHVAPKHWFQILSVASVSGVVILFAMMVELIPGPGFVTGIETSGRGIIWRAGIEAWRQRPVLGLGPGNNLRQLAPFLIGTGQEGSHVHNSYLRMLMSTGIIGFVAYVYFHVRTIGTHIKMVNDPAMVCALLLVIVYSINQMTNIFSLFGFTVTSVVVSLAFGFVLRDLTTSHD